MDYSKGSFDVQLGQTYRGTQIVWYVLGLIEMLLAFKFELKLLGANPEAGFSSFIYAVTYVFAAPFLSVFRITQVAGSTVEWTTLLSMFVYLVVAYGIIQRLRGLDGQKLSRSNIELILKDSFYYGMAHSKKYGLYPHRYQVLITRELFDKCQSVREGRSRKPSKELSKPFIFKGILVCKNCGCLLSPEIKKGKFIYYACTNAKGICKRVYVPENELLKPIRAVFEKFKQIPKAVQDKLVSELRALNEGEAEFHNREITRIRAEYARLQTRTDGLVDLLLDKSITKTDYDKKLQDTKDKQYRLNVELDEYTKADHQYHIHVGTVINLCRRIADIFDSSEPMEKRAILNFLLQNPTVSGKKIDFTMRKPFDVVLELASQPTGLRG